MSRKQLIGKQDLQAPEAPAGRARSSGTLGEGPKSKREVRRAKDQSLKTEKCPRKSKIEILSFKAADHPRETRMGSLKRLAELQDWKQSLTGDGATSQIHKCWFEHHSYL